MKNKQKWYAYLKEYRAYMKAKDRCINPNNPDYKHYGGRNIHFKFISFDAFLQELGTCPKGCILDRIDNNRHYESGNIRWATYKQSNNNQRHKTRPIICVSTGEIFSSINAALIKYGRNKGGGGLNNALKRGTLYLGKAWKYTG